MNPLYFMIPAAVHCSYAFMLPVGTPCNAMVATAGNIRTSTMVTNNIDILKIINQLTKKRYE